MTLTLFSNWNAKSCADRQDHTKGTRVKGKKGMHGRRCKLEEGDSTKRTAGFMSDYSMQLLFQKPGSMKPDR